MTKRTTLTISLALLLVTAAWAADVLVEDWSKYQVGAKGLPEGWKGQDWGSPKYDFTVAEDGGRRVLHMKSKDEGSTISKDIKGKIDLKQTPILEWSWKAVALPKGGNSCVKSQDDQAAQVFVVFPRFPEMVRSQIIGYVWDTTQAVGKVCNSEKTGTVTYIVVRSGESELGKWLTERRNVREDFKKVYGSEPDKPAAVSLSIDSNDTHSMSEAFVGTLLFRSP